jgi:hypothetical protein
MRLGNFMIGLGVLAIPLLGIPMLQTAERVGCFSRNSLKDLHARV